MPDNPFPKCARGMGMMKNGNAGGANDLFEGHQGGGGHGKGNGKN